MGKGGRVWPNGTTEKNAWAFAKTYISLKVYKIEIFFGFDFEICIISLLDMSKY
jgi:hypothetical protein